MGRAVPDLDEPAFDQGDLDAAELLVQLRATGIGEEGLLEVTRVLGRALRQGADAIRGVFERAFVEAGVPEDQFAQRNARLAKGLLDLTGPLLTYVLTVHLREGIWAEAVGEAGRAASGELAGARAVGVAFVDLVGYTRLGEQVEADEVGAVAQRLEALSTEVAVAPVRVVKTIGDAVMLVAPDATRLLGTVLELVDRVAAEGDDYPEAHAGVAFGPALARGGDWYGHPVNLASRITAIARPRSVRAPTPCARWRARSASAGHRPGPASSRGCADPSDCCEPGGARTGRTARAERADTALRGYRVAGEPRGRPRAAARTTIVASSSSTSSEAW